MMQTMMNGSHMGGGMMLGMGIVGFLVLAALILLVAGLIKYVFFR